MPNNTNIHFELADNIDYLCSRLFEAENAIIHPKMLDVREVRMSLYEIKQMLIKLGMNISSTQKEIK